jgi:hypothetical protein
MSDDCGTISNRLAIVDNIRELAARRGRGVKDVPMSKGRPCQFEKREYLQPIAVVIRDAKEEEDMNRG